MIVDRLGRLFRPLRSGTPDEEHSKSSWRTSESCLKATKAQIREVDTAEADELRQEPGAVVLDVREADEYEQGAIPGALHIPRGTLETLHRGPGAGPAARR